MTPLHVRLLAIPLQQCRSYNNGHLTENLFFFNIPVLSNMLDTYIYKYIYNNRTHTHTPTNAIT